MDELREKVAELQEALDAAESGGVKATDWWALVDLAMVIIKMILEKFRPSPTPNP